MIDVAANSGTSVDQAANYILTMVAERGNFPFYFSIFDNVSKKY